MTERPLTSSEVAELLGVTPETVRDYAERGLLAGSRLPGGPLRGGRWRFQRSDVEAVLNREVAQ